MIFPAGTQIIPNPNSGVGSATQGLGKKSKVGTPGQGFAQALAGQPSKNDGNVPKGLSNQIIGSSKALSLLFRKLSNIDPENIPSILSSNGFLKESLAGDVAAVLEQKLTLAEISEKLDIDPTLLPESLTAKFAGQPIKIKDFLKKVGIDPHAISAELERLRQRVTQHGMASLSAEQASTAHGKTLAADRTVRHPSRRAHPRNPTQNPMQPNQSSGIVDQRPLRANKLAKSGVHEIDRSNRTEDAQDLVKELKGRGKNQLKELTQHTPASDVGDRFNRVDNFTKSLDQSQSTQHVQETFEPQLPNQMRDIGWKTKEVASTTDLNSLSGTHMSAETYQLTEDASSKLNLANPLLERIADASQKLEELPNEAATRSKFMPNQLGEVTQLSINPQAKVGQTIPAMQAAIQGDPARTNPVRSAVLRASQLGTLNNKVGSNSPKTGPHGPRMAPQLQSRMLAANATPDQMPGTENSESNELVSGAHVATGRNQGEGVHLNSRSNSQTSLIAQASRRPNDLTRLTPTGSATPGDIGAELEKIEHFETEAKPEIAKPSNELRSQLADLAKKATDMLQVGESKATVNLEDIVIDLVLNNETNVVDVTASSDVAASLQALQSETTLLQSVLKEEGFELGSFETNSEHLQNQEFQRNENPAENQKVPFQFSKDQLGAPANRIPSPFAIPISGGSSVQLRV